MKVRSSIPRGIAAAALAASAAFAVPAVADAGETNISMQAQQKDNWCWDASGNTIASF